MKLFADFFFFAYLPIRQIKPLFDESSNRVRQIAIRQIIRHFVK